MRSLMWGPSSADGIALRVTHAQTRPSTKHENNGVVVRNIHCGFTRTLLAVIAFLWKSAAPLTGMAVKVTFNWRCAGIHVTWGKATSDPRFAYFKFIKL